MRLSQEWALSVRLFSFLRSRPDKAKSYAGDARAEASFWGDFTTRWISTGLIPPWADVRLAISQAIVLGHRDRVLAGELENLSRKLRFLRDILHRVAYEAHRRSIRVLDLGCGAGFLSLEMGRQGAEVLGVDISPGQIAVARYFAERGMRWPQALYPVYQGLRFAPDEYRPPRYMVTDLNRESPHGAFDVIVAHDAIHHLAEPESLLRNLEPQLEIGGIILILDHQECEGRREVWEKFRRKLIDLCGQWTRGETTGDLPRAEPYRNQVAFPEGLGREIMSGLAERLRAEGFPVCEVSEASGESLPPPWPTDRSSFEGISKSELGKRLLLVARELGFREITFESALEPWSEDLVSLRLPGMEWETFYGLRAMAEEEILKELPEAGDFFYLRARKG